MENPDIRIIDPPNLGWIEKKLNKNEIIHLQKCIDERCKKSHKKELAGNIHESNSLVDINNWFFDNTLLSLCQIYADQFINLGDKIPINQKHPYYLGKFWVNFQKENEFNPLHDHSGIYSFVIWMQIPTKHLEQNKNPIALNSNSPKISSFEINYLNILGKIESYTYEMNPEIEGIMLFFPSEMKHQVYPFYNCDEDRISISGNIFIDTKTIY